MSEDMIEMISIINPAWMNDIDEEDLDVYEVEIPIETYTTMLVSSTSKEGAIESASEYLKNNVKDEKDIKEFLENARFDATHPNQSRIVNDIVYIRANKSKCFIQKNDRHVPSQYFKSLLKKGGF